MGRLFHFFIAIIGAAVSASETDASTITVATQSLGVNAQFPASQVACTQTTTANTAACSSSDATAFYGGNTTASATATADVVTGVLKASALGSATTNLGESALSPIASIEISETFVVDGQVTFGMAVSGTWNAFSLFGSATQVNNQATVAGGSGLDNISFTAPTGSVNQIISFTTNFGLPTQLTVNWKLLSQIVTGQGTSDFSNTGLLFIDAAPGSSATPTNSQFLANQQFGSEPNPSLIPVPTGLPLLLSAFLGFAILREKKSAKK